MEAFASDWLNLLIRWTHMIVGIGWIGTSFYFIALDNSLKKRAAMNEGVYGTAWEVHGGGFYHVEKYMVAPKHLPDDLIWFKWEAYLTFLTGFALLVVQYYWHAKTYLIDPNVMALEPWQAIAISVGSLLAGWAIYDGLCRSPIGKDTGLLAIMVFALIVVASALFSQVFSGRGALIHVGAFVGTIMAANVFMVIVPNQRKLVAQLMKGEEPDPRYGRIGKQRSVHNTYLTLPVLAMMVSNHYSFLTGHPHSWVLVALILIIGGTARHFMVRHDAGDPIGRIIWAPATAAVGLTAALIMTAPRTDPALAAMTVSDAEVLQIAKTHCAVCHAAKPRHEGFTEAPKEVKLESIKDIRRWAMLIDQQAVRAEIMPPGNETQMTVDERKRLGAWIARQ